MTPIPIDSFRPVPEEARRIWREHFGFFASDPVSGDAVLVHLSLDPVRRNGVFTLVAWIEGRRVKEIVQAPVPGRLESLTEIGTERLKVIFREPGRVAQVRYIGDTLSLDIHYVTIAGPHRAPPAGENALFPVDNEQQVVRTTGTIILSGAVRDFDGLGSRDHSWGWFPEWAFAAHEWLTIILSDRAYQLSLTSRPGGVVNQSANVLESGGSQPLFSATISAPYWRVPENTHLPQLDRDVEIELIQQDGRVTRAILLLADTKARHHSNKRDRQLNRIYEQVSILAKVKTDAGEVGVAMVEIGCLVERPGVCDEPLPGAPAPHLAEEGR